MRPFKSLVPLAKWLLRIALVIVIYVMLFDRFLDFDFSSTSWFVSALLIIFSALLLVGGFIRTASLTVVSGLLVFVLSIIMILLHGLDVNSLAEYIGPAVIGFYFMARGNKG